MKTKREARKATAFSAVILPLTVTITALTAIPTGCRSIPAKVAGNLSSSEVSGSETPSSATLSSAASNSDSGLDISLSSKLSDTAALPEITNNVDAAWKTGYADIAVANAWIGANAESDNRCIVLCGALKSDPRQGAAEVVQISKSKNSVTYEKRYLAPAKHGALRVYMLGAKDFTMGLTDEDGLKWNFEFFNGFDPSFPVS